MWKGKDDEDKQKPPSGGGIPPPPNSKITSKFAPSNKLSLVHTLMDKDLISSAKADELTNRAFMDGTVGIKKGPMAPIVRPAHFEHIPASIQPNEETELFPHDDLEKSSSSYLRDQDTPSSTPDEDEVGQFEFKIFCLRKKKHYVNRLYKSQEEADLFGSVLLLSAIIYHLPALGFSILYVLWHSFRRFILMHYFPIFVIFGVFILIYILLINIAGLARRYPYHLILIVSKSIMWSFIYLGLTALTEYCFIKTRIVSDSRYNKRDTNSSYYHQMYTEFVINNYTGAEMEKLGVHNTLPLEMYLFGLCFGLGFMIIFYFLVTFTRFSFFGPIYPFITYTVTFILITVSTVIVFNRLIGITDDHNIPWELFQCIFGALIGCIMPQMFVDYLEKLLDGKLCPLKKSEFFYAAAHY